MRRDNRLNPIHEGTDGIQAIDLLGRKVSRHDGASFAALVDAVARREISGTTAKELFAEMCAAPLNVRETIVQRGLGQISDTAALEKIVAEVIAANPHAVADWKAGKQQAVGFLVGQAMKASKGRGDAALLGELIRSALDR